MALCGPRPTWGRCLTPVPARKGCSLPSPGARGTHSSPPLLSVLVPQPLNLPPTSCRKPGQPGPGWVQEAPLTALLSQGPGSPEGWPEDHICSGAGLVGVASRTPGQCRRLRLGQAGPGVGQGSGHKCCVSGAWTETLRSLPRISSPASGLFCALSSGCPERWEGSPGQFPAQAQSHGSQEVVMGGLGTHGGLSPAVPWEGWGWS